MTTQKTRAWTTQEIRDWARGSFDALLVIANLQGGLEVVVVEREEDMMACRRLDNILRYCWLQRIGKRISESVTRLEIELGGYYIGSVGLRGRYRESSVSAGRICIMGGPERTRTEG